MGMMRIDRALLIFLILLSGTATAGAQGGVLGGGEAPPDRKGVRRIPKPGDSGPPLMVAPSESDSSSTADPVGGRAATEGRVALGRNAN